MDTEQQPGPPGQPYELLPVDTDGHVLSAGTTGEGVDPSARYLTCGPMEGLSEDELTPVLVALVKQLNGVKTLIIGTEDERLRDRIWQVADAAGVQTWEQRTGACSPTLLSQPEAGDRIPPGIFDDTNLATGQDVIPPGTFDAVAPESRAANFGDPDYKPNAPGC